MVVYYREISEDILYFLSVIEFQTAYYFIWYSTSSGVFSYLDKEDFADLILWCEQVLAEEYQK